MDPDNRTDYAILLICGLLLSALFVTIGRSPYVNYRKQKLVFTLSLAGCVIWIGSFYSILKQLLPESYVLLGVSLCSFVFGRYMKYRNGSVVWRKTSVGEITIVENKHNKTLVMKRDNKALSGVNLVTMLPTSDLYLYPELAKIITPTLKRVLCIGGGACVYPSRLHAHDPKIKIDVVEIDPAVVEGAELFFSVRSDKTLSIIVDDGYAWLQQRSSGLYDVIFVDSGIRIAPNPFNVKFLDTTALKRYKRQLAPNGVLFINTITSRRQHHIQTLLSSLRKFSESFDSHFMFFIHPAGDASEVQDILHVFTNKPVSYTTLLRRFATTDQAKFIYPKNLLWDKLLTSTPVYES